MTAAQPAIPFGQLIILGDIVAVNGTPVKGVWALRATDLFLTPTVGVQPPNQPPQGRQAIADVQRGHIQDMIWDILDLNSNPIGTITASGFSRGPRAPGAPAEVTLCYFFDVPPDECDDQYRMDIQACQNANTQQRNACSAEDTAGNQSCQTALTNCINACPVE